MISKEQARELVRQYADIAFSFPDGNIPPSTEAIPTYLDFYNGYGRMVNIRLYSKIENGEIHFYGYKFHLLPEDHRVADARGWKSIKEPGIVGWCKLSSKNIEWANQRIYEKDRL